MTPLSDRKLMFKLISFFTGLVLLTGAALLPSPLWSQEPSSSSVSDKKEGKGGKYITIDFDNVDIHLFIKYISELTGKNFVIDKAVQGNVSIISPTKITEEQAYKVFESVLEVHGFTTVTAGPVIKILPSARARSQNLEMVQGKTTQDPDDKVVTQLVPLKYSSPEDLKKILTPLVSQTSVIIAHTPSGMLIITETQANIHKLLGIIKVLDVESREDEIAVIPLHNASTDALAKILNTVYQRSAASQRAAAGGQDSETAKIVPYDRVNALVVLASTGEMSRIRSLVKLLDTEVARPEGNIHVYYLQHATAVEMAKVLNALPEQQPQKGTQEKPKTAAISTDVQIMADEETNALLITASRDEYAVLESVIKQLDIPRRMVYLEALIMEVDADKTFDVGVQWAGAGAFDDTTGQLVTGFSGSEGFNLLEGISVENPALPAGFSIGVLKQGIQIGDVVFPNIAAILKAYKTDSDVNIITTPQVLTMDNKKAEISVGQNVPYITSQNTSVNNQDYTQYEYRDVATKLSIMPHINRADALRLEIETEVTRIKGTAESGTPTTFKRTASTTVVLNNNDTVVIGGIIGSDYDDTEWKIPLLGDIPVLGWLFKTHNMNSRKTNMFIFITPRIIKNPADLIAATMEKEDTMEALQPGVKQHTNKKPNPEHTLNLLDRGYYKLQENRIDEAMDYFQAALKIDPHNPYALFNIGAVYEIKSDPANALKTYERIIADGGSGKQPGFTPQQHAPLINQAQAGVKRVSGIMEQQHNQSE
ncbi:type II secretion system secretin GspD [Desulforhopalus singaporensis]|uniref:General secretion pathway protein D n=1 Tax=Desulforhopalus singaporensis TaxID=91360 RepID=A0A1H0M124_9BACT|nr:type II secretion system secretin GspD [Desulforhopalus singaporensis]SDO74158.1 general secretion pathway protein D [Desulforhopalus singaporensis]